MKVIIKFDTNQKGYFASIETPDGKKIEGLRNLFLFLSASDFPVFYYDVDKTMRDILREGAKQVFNLATIEKI